MAEFDELLEFPCGGEMWVRLQGDGRTVVCIPAEQVTLDPDFLRRAGEMLLRAADAGEGTLTKNGLVWDDKEGFFREPAKPERRRIDRDKLRWAINKATVVGAPMEAHITNALAAAVDNICVQLDEILEETDT